jgi:hypothetical protein
MSILVFRRDEDEDLEFMLSIVENVVERMNDDIKQELDAFKYDIHAIMSDILNGLRFLPTLNFSTHKEDEENKIVESQKTN